MLGDIFVAGLVGLVLGSFAGALSYRLVRGEDWISQPSCCPKCGMRLTPLDLLPVVGYLIRHGYCAHCGQSISRRYPIIEVICSLACILSILAFGLSVDGLLMMALSLILVAMAAADLEVQILPDELQIALALAGVLFSIHHGFFWSGLIACVSGTGFGLLLRWAYRRFRQLDALGLGDVKFFGAAGFWMGIDYMSVFIGLGAIFGLGLAAIMVKGPRDRIPFGVALALSLFVIQTMRQMAGLLP